MENIMKRLPPFQTILAILFLFVQIGSSLYLPYITAQIVNNGVIAGDTAYIWMRGGLMIGLSLISLLGAVINTLLFSRISYKLGEDLRSDVYHKALQFSKKEFLCSIPFLTVATVVIYRFTSPLYGRMQILSPYWTVVCWPGWAAIRN